MKLVLPIVALFAFASAADAQERVNTLPDPVPVVAPAPVTAPAASAVPVLRAPATDADATAENAAATANASTEAPSENAAFVQDTPRNFWWLVGGIVLAGVILALIL